VREHGVGHLRGVHHRAAADGEEGVGAGLPRGRRTFVAHVGRGVLRDLVVDAHDLEATVRHACLHAVHEAGAADHLVGDHEHPPRALLLELESRRAQEVTAGDHPGGRGVLVEVLESP
jgi:hypothetical protein